MGLTQAHVKSHNGGALGLGISNVSLKLFASTLCRFLLGCSRKNPQPHDGWDSGNSRGRGGQILWKSRREGGLNLKKSSARVILTDNSRDSNVKFGDSSSLSDPENSTNICSDISHLTKKII